MELERRFNGYAENVGNAMGINKSPVVDTIDNEEIDEITVERIKYDMDYLYTRYVLMHNNDDEINKLFVTFVSSSDKHLIEQRLRDSKDFDDMLKVFDDLIEKTENIIQLLYENYVTSD